MDKVTKLIRMALNNSNANEASQALKTAVNIMQREGVNPSTLLSFKGDQPSNDLLHALNERICELEIENSSLMHMLETSASNPSNEELREAKIIAIKWHKRATEIEEESIEYARSAVKSENEARNFEKMLNKKKTAFLWLFLFAAFEGLIIFIRK